MHVRCPHCHNPIELVGDDLSGITCPSCGSQFSLISGDTTATHQSNGGRTIGHFELIHQVGVGAFGSVWKARDKELDRTVAVKIPRRDQISGSEADAFFREARAAAQLRHPQIVGVHEVGREGDTIYIVSDFIEGANLKEWLSSQRLSPREAAELVAKVAEALHHAHESGVVHRDLKPGNIMLDLSGQPHITDFGLAKRDSGEMSITLEGKPLGTPNYMPPEQAKGEGHHADRRSDVYSLGVILFELLTGEVPFRGEAQMVLVQIQKDEPPRPRRLDAKIPRDLETITLKCLEKEPAKRYQTAQALADDLQCWLGGRPIVARPVGRLARGWRWARREPMVATLAAAVLVVLLAGISVSTWFGIEASISAREAKRRAAAEQQARVGLAQNAAELERALERSAASERRAAEAARQSSVSEAKAARSVIQLQEALKQSERNAYVAQMRLVDRALADGYASSARMLLDSVAVGNRGWEWEFAARELSQEILTLKKHTGRVTSVAFSSDGRRIVSGSIDQTLKLWDAETGQEIRTLKGHNHLVESVAFSPDARRIVSGSLDETLKVWDAETGQELRTLKGHTSAPESVAFSPDGRRIVSGSVDQTIKLWDAETGQEIRTLKGHKHTVWSVAFSPDGRRIISGGETLKLWDAETGQEVRAFPGHTNDVLCVAPSPDGRRIVSGSYDGTLKLWDAESGQEVRTFKGHPSYVTSVVFMPDGRRIVSGSYDGTLKLWDAESGQEVRTFKGHRDTVMSVACRRDGRRIVSASGDKTLKLWDADAGQERLTLKGHTGSVSSVAFRRDGRRIVSASGDKTLKLWDADAGQELRTLKGHTGSVTSVAFSLDGQRIVSGSVDKTLKLWNADAGQELRTLKGHTGSVTSVAFSLDGQRIVSGNVDKTLKLWDAVTGQELRTLNSHTSGVSSVAFSPDGRRIASGSYDGTVKLWDVETGQSLRTLNSHTSGVSSVAFSPDGRRIVSGMDDHALKLWDAETGQELLTLKGHTGGVMSVAFSPDGSRIVSGSYDKTLKLWDAENGQELRTLKEHEHTVSSVAFSSHGRRIVSASNDRTIKLWNAEPLDEPARYARVLAREALEDCFDPSRARSIIEGKTDLPAELKDAAVAWLARISDPVALARMARHQADLEADQGQWAPATEHFQIAAELVANCVESQLLASLALAAMAAGDNANYRRTCERLWDQYHDSGDPDDLSNMVTICSVGPDALADMRPLVDTAEANRSRNVGYHLLVPAMAIHYRAHEYEVVIKLQQAAELGYFVVARTPSFADVKWMRIPQTLFVAMAYQRLDKSEEAKKYLAVAQKAHDEWAEQEKPALDQANSTAFFDTGSWQRRLVLSLLRREAEALINKQAPTAPESTGGSVK